MAGVRDKETEKSDCHAQCVTLESPVLGVLNSSKRAQPLFSLIYIWWPSSEDTYVFLPFLIGGQAAKLRSHLSVSTFS